jgi:hypothetical protein
MADITGTPGQASVARGGVYDALGEAKRLLRSIRAGALATIGAEGTLLASLVSVATQADGSPLLLLSRLAGHTTHLEADPRCSLLLAQGGKGDPLAHPRLSVVGRAERIETEEGRAAARARFVARNPKAELYVDFPDFGFWQVTVSTLHLNGGFARAARFDAADVLTPLDDCAALVAVERGAIDHMNADHRDALQLYATVLAQAGEGDWRASGLDPEGLDLICGDRTARVEFGQLVHGPGELRRVLKVLADNARQPQGQ